jgi:polyisoprenoid-binding protein YceI
MTSRRPGATVQRTKSVEPKGETMSQQVLSDTEVPSIIPTGTWSIDPDHSRVGFAIRHLGIATVRGEFTSFEGTLNVGSDLSSTRVAGSVDAASIFTHQPQRDAHLRSADFFDVERYPTLSFESTRIEAIEGAAFAITGNLTMHGVTNEVVLEAAVRGHDTDQFGNERVGLEATGELSRSDFAISFNVPLASGTLLLADKVTLTLDISAIKQA